MKRFAVSFLCAALALLLLFAGAAALFDPLYQYHMPYFQLGAPQFLDRYQDPGLAKNYDYDALIVGSSMVRNCRASWFSEAFSCSALKLPVSAGYMTDFDVLLTTVFEAGSPKAVFFNLDLYALAASPGYQQSALPTYLYDQNLLNDVSYVLNKDVFLDVFPQYFAGGKNAEPFEDAYAFVDEYPFGREAVLKTYGRSAPSPRPEKQQPADALLDMTNENLACLTRHIEAHPETVFYVYYPPYSLLYWDSYLGAGMFDAEFASLSCSAETLLGYDNVRLYCFLGMDGIVNDLDNYMDNMHFTREVNELVVNEMAAGRYALTRENCEETLSELKDYLWNYDYESLFLSAA